MREEHTEGGINLCFKRVIRGRGGEAKWREERMRGRKDLKWGMSRICICYVKEEEKEKEKGENKEEREE